MRAINHALTGALIGLSIDQPAVAVLASFGSHYLLDAIPHYGPKIAAEEEKFKYFRSKFFGLSLIIDAALCGLLVLILFLRKPPNWLLTVICAFVAALPDIFSVRRYIYAHLHKKYTHTLYGKFAVGIQWFERPIGVVVEGFWLIGAVYLLAIYLR